MKNVPLSILLFVFVLNIFECNKSPNTPKSNLTQDTVSTSIDKTGYVFDFSYTVRNDSILNTYPVIYATSIPNEIPEVVIDGVIAQQSQNEFKWGAVYQAMPGKASGDSFVFSIQTRNDTLSGTFIIPPPVESVYFNGNYVPTGKSDSLGDIRSVTAKWPQLRNISRYLFHQVGYTASSPGQACGQTAIDTIIAGNQISFTVAPCVTTLNLEIYPLPSSPWVPGRGPDIESKTMFLYFSDPLYQKNPYNVELDFQ